jgi:hypothetical protein
MRSAGTNHHPDAHLFAVFPYALASRDIAERLVAHLRAGFLADFRNGNAVADDVRRATCGKCASALGPAVYIAFRAGGFADDVTALTRVPNADLCDACIEMFYNSLDANIVYAYELGGATGYTAFFEPSDDAPVVTVASPAAAGPQQQPEASSTSAAVVYAPYNSGAPSPYGELDEENPCEADAYASFDLVRENNFYAAADDDSDAKLASSSAASPSCTLDSESSSAYLADSESSPYIMGTDEVGYFAANVDGGYTTANTDGGYTTANANVDDGYSTANTDGGYTTANANVDDGYSTANTDGGYTTANANVDGGYTTANTDGGYTTANANVDDGYSTAQLDDSGYNAGATASSDDDGYAMPTLDAKPKPKSKSMSKSKPKPRKATLDGDKYKWTRAFLEVLHMPVKTTEEQLARASAMVRLSARFESQATETGKAILMERFLLDDAKSIRPVNLGGQAGGEKVCISYE